MTLVMAWRSEEMLFVCADTRISNGSDPITDVGQKIFQVPVSVTPFGFEKEPIEQTAVGFAFVGNTLMAQSCCAIASTCLSTLSSQTAETLVSPLMITKFFSKAAEYVSEERRFLTPGAAAQFEAMVFGWDGAKDEPFIYHIGVDDVNGVLEAAAVPAEIPVGRILYFGSGERFIKEQFEFIEQSAKQNSDTRTIRPHQLMEAAIAAG